MEKEKSLGVEILFDDRSFLLEKLKEKNLISFSFDKNKFNIYVWYPGDNRDKLHKNVCPEAYKKTEGFFMMGDNSVLKFKHYGNSSVVDSSYKEFDLNKSGIETKIRELFDESKNKKIGKK